MDLQRGFDAGVGDVMPRAYGEGFLRGAVDALAVRRDDATLRDDAKRLSHEDLTKILHKNLPGFDIPTSGPTIMPTIMPPPGGDGSPSDDLRRPSPFRTFTRETE